MRVLKPAAFVTGDPATLELHDIDIRKERYAILSHTWGQPQEEILFADLLALCDPAIKQRDGYLCIDLKSEAAAALKRKSGWAKLAFALEQADENCKNWLWVDTACIDRSSSAELMNAVNSMYAWYQGSAVCYAYLSDVPLEEWRVMQRNRTFRTRWNTRSWTLQELIAPGHVVFFSMEWARLGDKHELADLLSTATKIDEAIVNGNRSVEEECIAKRMSWAAHRECTQEEDVAYSLMALFNVNMPVLYGEGAKKAFHRLQQEIIKVSDDQSIFAWKDPWVGDVPHGLLADRPSAFAHASKYRSYSFEEHLPFDMSNRGLRINLHLSLEKDKECVAALQCPNPFSKDGYLAIHLKKLPSGDKQYTRIRCDEVTFLDSRGPQEEVFVRQTISPISLHQRQESVAADTSWNAVMAVHIFHVNKLRTWGDYKVVDVHFLPPKRSLDRLGLTKDLNRPSNIPKQFPITFKMAKEDHRITAAILLGREDDVKMVAVLLGSRTDCEPGYDIVECNDLAALKEYKRPFDPMEFGTMAFGKLHRVMVRAEILARADVKVYLIEIGVGAVEKALKHQSIERTDSVRTSTSNNSRMSWIVKKVARRYSQTSQ